MGVEEPLALSHNPNESVDPGEIERPALAEALFLRDYAAASGRRHGSLHRMRRPLGNDLE